MKFRSFLVVLFTLSFITFNIINAQTSTIAILPFKHSEGTEYQKEAAAMVTDRIFDRFIATGQAKVVEREFFKDLQDEKFLTSEIDFLDGSVVSKTKSIGAKYILTGKVSSLTMFNDKGSYKCNLSIGLRLIDVETGEVEKSYTMDSNKPLNASILEMPEILKEVLKQTPGDALKAAVKNLEEHIKDFTNKNFPLEVEIKGISLLSKDQKKAQELEIRIGEAKEAKKKTKYFIKEKYMDEGDTILKEVGEVEITEVLGKNLSTAKVTKGGDKIKEKIEAGAQLVAIEYFKTK